MVSEVAAEKHGQTFDMLDADRDGYLRRADFEAIAQRLSSSQHSTDSDACVVRDAYLTFWAKLIASLGLGDDAVISRSQYIGALDRVAKTSPNGFDQAIAQMPRAILVLFDRDRDGRLSEEEFLGMQAALGVERKAAEVALLALDKDADGYVGNEDLMQACREFVLSEDPMAPGNWLFGGLRQKPVRYFPKPVS